MFKTIVIWILMIPFRIWLFIDMYIKNYRFKRLRHNKDAFNRDFGIVVFRDMSKKYFLEDWNDWKENYKKLYEKGVCKIL